MGMLPQNRYNLYYNIDRIPLCVICMAQASTEPRSFIKPEVTQLMYDFLSENQHLKCFHFCHFVCMITPGDVPF